MVAISEFVSVEILIKDPTVDFPSFDSTLIFDPSLKFIDSNIRSKEYSSASELLKDKNLLDSSGKNIEVSSEAYKAASSFCLGLSKKFILGVGGSTSDGKIEEDLQDIRLNANFYYVVLASKNNDLILQTAAAIEKSDLNIFLTSSNEEGIVNTPKSDSGKDLANLLFQNAYKRTVLLYSSEAGKYPEAQWVSLKSSAPPGSVSWAYSNLSGLSPDNLSQGQFATAKKKNVNVFIRGGDSRRMTFDGKVIGNEYIDIMAGVDWLRASIQANVFRVLASRNEKIPFNNDGIAIIGCAVTEALENAKVNVLESYELNLPTIESFNSQERKERLLTKINWTGLLKGAIHTANIRGSVSY